MDNRERLESMSELTLVQAYAMRNDRHAVVVCDAHGEYWVSIDLPAITKDMDPPTRKAIWAGVIRTTVYGPLDNARLAKLHAQAFLCDDVYALHAYAAYSKKLIRRAVNKLWERYNRNYEYAIEATNALDIRQNIDNTMLVGKEVAYEVPA